jgi:hypothetical protein
MDPLQLTFMQPYWIWMTSNIKIALESLVLMNDDLKKIYNF